MTSVMKIVRAATLICMTAGTLASLGATANGASILQDGTFLEPIGTGLNLTPWSDWVNAGISTHPAPTGIPGNYASIPVNGDLFQRFDGPNPGVYTLSFSVRDASTNSAELVLSVQSPGGGTCCGGWLEDLTVLNLTPSTSFTRESITFNIYQPLGTPSEFYFSNSYDAPLPDFGLQNSVNPYGTVIDVADVSITPGGKVSPVPLPAALPMFAAAVISVGAAGRWRRKLKT